MSVVLTGLLDGIESSPVEINCFTIFFLLLNIGVGELLSLPSNALGGASLELVLVLLDVFLYFALAVVPTPGSSQPTTSLKLSMQMSNSKALPCIDKSNKTKEAYKQQLVE